MRTRGNVVRGSRQVGDVRKCLKESIEGGGSLLARIRNVILLFFGR